MNDMSGAFTRARKITAMVGGKTAATRAAQAALAPGQLDGLHETAAPSIAALLANVAFEGAISEPACGRLAIARGLAGAGYRVVASDIVDYGLKRCDIPAGVTLLSPRDFLRSGHAAAPNIVSNFPFDNQGSERCIAHGLSLLGRVPRRPGQTRKLVAFHKMRFLETPARDALLDSPLFAGVLALRERQPMMHRPDHTGAKIDKSTEFYGWFVWDLDHPRRPGQDAWVRRV